MKMGVWAIEKTPRVLDTGVGGTTHGSPVGWVDKPSVPSDTIIDNPQAALTGTWATATGYYGSNYRSHAKGTGSNKVVWTPNVPTPGTYQVYARWVAASTYASNAPYTIKYNGGSATVKKSQRTSGGTWVLLGSYAFSAGTTGNVTLTDSADGTVIADAIKLVATSGGTIQEALRSIHTDHLNTPRLATNASGTIIWRWEGKAFGDTAPNEDPDLDTIKTTINLRYPGQYYDQESGLFYNYFRTYDPKMGRYIQSDPIGLKGGLNTFLYANANPLSFVDPLGLYIGFWHGQYTRMGGGRAGLTPQEAAALAQMVVDVDDDHLHPGTQDPANAHMHAMCAPGMSRASCQEKYLRYIEDQLKSCSKDGLAKAVHAVQDSFAEGHRNFVPYNGLSHLPPSHLYNDSFPTPEEMKGVPIVTQNVIERFRENCSCSK